MREAVRLAPRASVHAAAWAPAIAWACLIFYLSAQSVPPEPPGIADIPFRDKAEHIVEYGIFGALLVLAVRRGGVRFASLPPKFDPAIAWLLAAAFAASDEFHQSFVPLRQADVFDFMADATGALLFALLAARYVKPRLEEANP